MPTFHELRLTTPEELQREIAKERSSVNQISFSKVRTIMATRTRSFIQDENLNVHYNRGGSTGRENNVSKTKKATGLGGLKPLTNITNSGKPSGQVVKKDQNKKLNGTVLEQGLHIDQEYVNPQASLLFQNENLVKSKGNSVGGKSLASDAQKKAGLGGNRKALSNITNSRKLSLQQESKKAFPKKLNDIAEEQCLHNHDECVKAQTKGMDMQFFFRTLGFDDDFYIPMGTPSIRPTSRATKVDTSSPSRYLEFEETLELLNEDDRSPPRCRTPMVASPSQNHHYPSSPTLMLLCSP